MTGKYRVERDGSGISKGPRDRNQTQVAASTITLYIGTLTTRLLALTSLSIIEI